MVKTGNFHSIDLFDGSLLGIKHHQRKRRFHGLHCLYNSSGPIITSNCKLYPFLGDVSLCQGVKSARIFSWTTYPYLFALYLFLFVSLVVFCWLYRILRSCFSVLFFRAHDLFFHSFFFIYLFIYFFSFFLFFLLS